MAIHKHCLLQFALFKNVVLENYVVTAFCCCNYVNIGLSFILISDKIILINGGVSFERSGRKIAVSAGKC